MLGFLAGKQYYIRLIKFSRLIWLMIPEGYGKDVKPIDAKELIGHSMEELESLDDGSLFDVLHSVESAIARKANEASNTRDSGLDIIKNYRILLNRIYGKCIDSGFVDNIIACKRMDYYWARKEKCLTGNLAYIFPSVTSPK